MIIYKFLYICKKQTDMAIQKTQMTIFDAKNFFLEWLEENATIITVYNQKVFDVFDYYKSITGYIDGQFLTVIFMMCDNKATIDYENNTTYLKNLSIDEFITILKA